LKQLVAPGNHFEQGEQAQGRRIAVDACRFRGWEFIDLGLTFVIRRAIIGARFRIDGRKAAPKCRRPVQIIVTVKKSFLLTIQLSGP
jgi:hypothetical protein